MPEYALASIDEDTQSLVISKLRKTFPQLLESPLSNEMEYLIVYANLVQKTTQCQTPIEISNTIHLMGEVSKLYFSNKGINILNTLKKFRVVSTRFVRESFAVEKPDKKTVAKYLDLLVNVGICRREKLDFQLFVALLQGKVKPPGYIAKTNIYLLPSANGNDYERIYDYYRKLTLEKTGLVSEAKKQAEFFQSYYNLFVKVGCPECESKMEITGRDVLGKCPVCNKFVIPTTIFTDLGKETYKKQKNLILDKIRHET